MERFRASSEFGVVVDHHWKVQVIDIFSDLKTVIKEVDVELPIQRIHSLNQYLVFKAEPKAQQKAHEE